MMREDERTEHGDCCFSFFSVDRDPFLFLLLFCRSFTFFTSASLLLAPPSDGLYLFISIVNGKGNNSVFLRMMLSATLSRIKGKKKNPFWASDFTPQEECVSFFAPVLVPDWFDRYWRQLYCCLLTLSKLLLPSKCLSHKEQTVTEEEKETAISGTVATTFVFHFRY